LTCVTNIYLVFYLSKNSSFHNKLFELGFSYIKIVD